MQTPKPIHLLAALLACSLGGAARAAEINGTVRNAQTGAFLEAVEVTVLDRGITTRTDREGRFSVPNLPAGEHRVRIAYPGSAEEVVTVNLADAVSTRSIDSALRPADDDRSVVQLGAFVVASEREGYSASVARQKAADNLQNIQKNSTAARSTVQDVDFASETAELTKQQTLQQASTAILSQANQLPSSVLKLLQ